LTLSTFNSAKNRFLVLSAVAPDPPHVAGLQLKPANLRRRHNKYLPGTAGSCRSAERKEPEPIRQNLQNPSPLMVRIGILLENLENDLVLLQRRRDFNAEFARIRLQLLTVNNCRETRLITGPASDGIGATSTTGSTGSTTAPPRRTVRPREVSWKVSAHD